MDNKKIMIVGGVIVGLSAICFFTCKAIKKNKKTNMDGGIPTYMYSRHVDLNDFYK